MKTQCGDPDRLPLLLGMKKRRTNIYGQVRLARDLEYHLKGGYRARGGPCAVRRKDGEKNRTGRKTAMA